MKEILMKFLMKILIKIQVSHLYKTIFNRINFMLFGIMIN